MMVEHLGFMFSRTKTMAINSSKVRSLVGWVPIFLNLIGLVHSIRQCERGHLE